MAITAKQVKELRDMTQAGMMDCKKALTATDGDIDKAVDWLRENGLAKSAKKSGRIAAEGLSRALVSGNTGVVFEINSETDFVAKNELFLELINNVGNALLAAKPADMDAAQEIDCNGVALKDAIVNATATIGEKISFRRFAIVEKTDDQFFGAYMHNGGKISALVLLNGAEDAAIAKNMAMQVASMSPLYISQKDVPAEELQRETDVQRAAMAQDEKLANKPEKVLEGILRGKVSKHFQDVCLMDQVYFLDGKAKVSQFLKENKLSVASFVRYEVGEGMEKREENFAEEVAAQMKK